MKAERARAGMESESYPIPPSAVARTTVFSSEFRRRILGRLSWMAIAAAIVPPLLAALLADAVGAGPVANAVLIAGVVLPTIIYILATNRLAPSGGPALERGIRAKFATEGIEFAGAEFVSLAPTAETRVYDGFSQWDAGVLWLAASRFVYVGEHARFSLSRDNIDDIRIGRGLPGWLPTRRVYVDWHDSVTGARGTFAVWPGAARSTLRLKRAAHDLAARLRAWRTGEVEGGRPTPFDDIGPPAFPTVHGVAPAHIVRPRVWLRSLFLLGPLTAGLCVLAGIPFRPTLFSGGGYVLAVTVAALAVQVLPYWLAREPREGTPCRFDAVPAEAGMDPSRP